MTYVLILDISHSIDSKDEGWIFTLEGKILQQESIYRMA